MMNDQDGDPPPPEVEDRSEVFDQNSKHRQLQTADKREATISEVLQRQ